MLVVLRGWARSLLVEIGGLVDAGGCAAEGVLGGWVKDPSVVWLAMVAAEAIVYLPGGIAALLPHPSRTIQLWGKPLIFVIGRCATPSCRVPSWGPRLWS